MKLKEAVKKAEESIEETLACCDFPSEHWARIHINNARIFIQGVNLLTTVGWAVSRMVNLPSCQSAHGCAM